MIFFCLFVKLIIGKEVSLVKKGQKNYLSHREEFVSFFIVFKIHILALSTYIQE